MLKGVLSAQKRSKKLVPFHWYSPLQYPPNFAENRGLLRLAIIQLKIVELYNMHKSTT